MVISVNGVNVDTEREIRNSKYKGLKVHFRIRICPPKKWIKCAKPEVDVYFDYVKPEKWGKKEMALTCIYGCSCSEKCKYRKWLNYRNWCLKVERLLTDES